MSKKLCDLKKLLRSDFDSYVELVRDPKYVCKTCGRVAKDKNRLCKPQRLKGDSL